MKVTAYIAMGSNLDEPREQIRRALDALAAAPGCVLRGASSLYRSRPMGPPNQPDYLNAVARLETSLDAFELLAQLQRIERAQGRSRSARSAGNRQQQPIERSNRWGARTLDLDLLLYGAESISSRTLTVPHPGLHERDFVLQPLLELDAELVVPGYGPVCDLIAACPRYRLVEDRIPQAQ